MEYEQKLLNQENMRGRNLKMVKVERSCKKVSIQEVIGALNFMTAKKAAGPSRVTSELLKVCEKEKVKRLVKVANDTLERRKRPENWRWSDLIPIHQGKSNIRSCGNYRNINPQEHGMQVVERNFEKRLPKVVELDELQMVFMPGKSNAYNMTNGRKV